jgi:hypothetical protein
VEWSPPAPDPHLDGTLPGEYSARAVNALLLLRSAGEMGPLELVEMPASGM